MSVFGSISEADIYDHNGRRKYLTPTQRRRFKMQAARLPASERDFCMMHYYAGVRISEALAIASQNIDVAEGIVIVRCLKRRKRALFRAIPLPRKYLRGLLRLATGRPPQARLWRFSRKTGYRIIKEVMLRAGITGVAACPKGLRHGFGIVCAQKSIPLPTISKWMGHSSIKTTAIYLNAVGPEERAYAKRIW